MHLDIVLYCWRVKKNRIDVIRKEYLAQSYAKHGTQSQSHLSHYLLFYLDREQIFDAPGLEFGHDGFGDVEVGELASFFVRIDDRRRGRVVFGKVLFVRQRRRRRRRRG